MITRPFNRVRASLYTLSPTGALVKSPSRFSLIPNHHRISSVTQALGKAPQPAAMSNSKTEYFPDGVMGSLRAELELMAGFIGAFILSLVVWYILFKYFSDKEDRQHAKVMARGTEMRGGMRHQDSNREEIMEPAGIAVQDGENKVLAKERGS